MMNAVNHSRVLLGFFSLAQVDNFQDFPAAAGEEVSWGSMITPLWVELLAAVG